MTLSDHNLLNMKEGANDLQREIENADELKMRFVSIQTESARAALEYIKHLGRLTGELELKASRATDWKQFHSALSQCAELLDNMEDGDDLARTPVALKAKLEQLQASRAQRTDNIEIYRDQLRREIEAQITSDAAPAVLQGAAVPAEPVAWIRFRSDGGYEGPIMHAAIEEVRKRSGAWTPLYAAPASAAEPECLSDADMDAMHDALDRVVAPASVVAAKDEQTQQIIDKQVAEWRKEVVRLQDLIATATGSAPPFAAPVSQHDAICPDCHGTGEVDSGGVHPWGDPAMISCGCDEKQAVVARTIEEAELLKRLKWAVRFIETYAHKAAMPCTPEMNKCRAAIASAEEVERRCRAQRTNKEVSRDEVLEEAAEACGKIGASDIGAEGTRAALDCIAAIRALKGTATPAPAPAGGDARDAQDAARYRWLTEVNGLRYSPPGGMAIRDLDAMNAAIDAAMTPPVSSGVLGEVK